jgi:hypothetical protein
MFLQLNLKIAGVSLRMFVRRMYGVAGSFFWSMNGKYLCIKNMCLGKWID